MKVVHYVAIVAFLLNLSSCKSKTPSSRAIQLVKNTWKFDDLTSPTPDPAALEALERKKAFLVDQELTFNEEQTYAATFALATDSASNILGSWELSSDEKTLKLMGSGNDITWNIGRLDDDILELKGYDLTLNVDVRYVYKRK